MDEEAGDLFSTIGVSLPVATAPGDSDRIREFVRGCSGRRFLRLVWDQRNACVAASEQLSFAFTPPSQVVVVPTDRMRTYLDYGVYDCFRDVEFAVKPALRLAAYGVHYMGQFVQLREGEIRRIARADDAALFAIRARLACMGLFLGMLLPANSGYQLLLRKRTHHSR